MAKNSAQVVQKYPKCICIHNSLFMVLCESGKEKSFPLSKQKRSRFSDRKPVQKLKLLCFCSYYLHHKAEHPINTPSSAITAHQFQMPLQLSRQNNCQIVFYSSFYYLDKSCGIYNLALKFKLYNTRQVTKQMSNGAWVGSGTAGLPKEVMPLCCPPPPARCPHLTPCSPCNRHGESPD